MPISLNGYLAGLLLFSIFNVYNFRRKCCKCFLVNFVHSTGDNCFLNDFFSTMATKQFGCLTTFPLKTLLSRCNFGRGGGGQDSGII